MARIVVTLAAVMTQVACATAPAIKVNTDHDPASAARLRSYRTYRAVPAASRGPVEDVAMGPAVVRSIEETLGGKGYRLDAARPDFLVGWHVAIETAPATTMESPTFRDVRPMPSAGSTSPPRTVTYSEARLSLDIVDAASNRIVWRGSAQAPLAARSEPLARDARLQESVRRILERFPPASPGME
jgi:hypothetical protein